MHRFPRPKEAILILLFCALGCLICLYLQLIFNMPNYAASALTGLLGSFLPSVKLYDHKKMIACIYAGSFSAMCSLTYLGTTVNQVLLCILTGFSFILFGSFFRGVGGKLGSIAFIASIILFLTTSKAIG